MSPTDFALPTALLVTPSVFSGGAALLVGHCFGIRNRPRAMLAAGLLLGLLLTPVAMVTVGTIGGGYWDWAGLPGGPLVGVVLSVGTACALTTALFFGISLGSWKAAKWAARRCPLFSQVR